MSGSGIAPPPLRVLMSAYTCVPGKGSEPGAGWAWAAAAAEAAEVWLLTEHSCRAEIEAELRAHPRPRLHPVYVDAPPWARWRSDQLRGNRLRYTRWQLAARSTARRLHGQIDFDLVHHITNSGDWLPIGVAGALPGVPFVWGPVAGAAASTRSLWGQIGPVATAKELARLAVTGAGRRSFGDRAARAADLLLAQNHDGAERYSDAHRVIVEPNPALDRAALPTRPPEHLGRHAGPRRAVFAGRLLHWKGPALAVAALARPEAADWLLDVYGDGPERVAIQAAAQSLGVSDRVRLLGTEPRSVVLNAMASADALLFPSLHDSAGWVVAEAIAVGCPVVCLDVAGPQAMVGPDQGICVPIRGHDVGDIAGALARGLADVPPPTSGSARFDAQRLPAMLSGWYREVAGRPTGSSVELRPVPLPELEEHPLVTVIMANHNYARFLSQAVDSVLSQTYDNVELVVCDDASTDGSREVLAELATAADHRLRVVMLDDTVGQHRAMQTALRHSSGTVVCFLDADDWFAPDKIESVLAEFRRPSVGMVTHRLASIDQDGTPGSVIPGRATLPRGWQAAAAVRAGGMLPGLPSTTALALRREIAERILGSDGDTQYVDLNIQLIGPLITELGSVERPLATYRWHGGNTTTDTFTDPGALARTMRQREASRRVQQKLLASMGHPDLLAPIDDDLFYAKLRYAHARVTASADRASLHRRLVGLNSYAGQSRPDRALWSIAPLLPRPIFTILLRQRLDPTSRLRRLLVRRR